MWEYCEGGYEEGDGDWRGLLIHSFFGFFLTVVSVIFNIVGLLGRIMGLILYYLA